MPRALWDSIRKAIFKPAKNMVYGKLKNNQVPDPLKVEPEPIEPNNCYLNIALRSMRIVHVQVGFQKLYGVVHSFIKLPIYHTKEARFNVVTTPNELKNVDRNNLDRVIQGDKELLGPVPYRGGKVKLQIGLFAVKSENLVDNYLTLLGELADVASVDMVRQAIPFLKPITKGIDLILGVGSQSNLIIGLQQSLKPKIGHYVITNAPTTSSFKLNKLRLDENYRLCNKDGTLFDKYAYMVFSIYPTYKRDTWFDIPDLGTAFQNLMLAKKSGTPESVKQNYNIFAKAIMSSPDLLVQDANRIKNQIYKDYVKDQPLVPELPQLNLPEMLSKSRKKAEPLKPELMALLNFPKKLSKKDQKIARSL